MKTEKGTQRNDKQYIHLFWNFRWTIHHFNSCVCSQKENSKDTRILNELELWLGHLSNEMPFLLRQARSVWKCTHLHSVRVDVVSKSEEANTWSFRKAFWDFWTCTQVNKIQKVYRICKIKYPLFLTCKIPLYVSSYKADQNNHLNH